MTRRPLTGCLFGACMALHRALGSPRLPGMRRASPRGTGLVAVAVVVGALAAGCGRFAFPRPLRAPAPAHLNQRSPSFTVTSAEGVEVSSSDFLGHALVVVAAEQGYVGDVARWLRFVEGRAGKRPEACKLLAIIGDDCRVALRLAPSLPEEVGLYVDLLGVSRMRAFCRSAELRARAGQIRKDEPGRADRMERAAKRIDAGLSRGRSGFRDAFGFVGEGPLVVVVGSDGTLLAMIDGPPDGGRREKLAAALDEAASKK